MAKKKSDLSRAFSEDGPLKTHVGGQALLEGIMMRGRYNWSVAVREPDGGIYTEEHDLKSGRAKNSWLRWPLVRGCTAFVESLALGYKALEISAMHAFPEEEEACEGKADFPAERGSAGRDAADAAVGAPLIASDPSGDDDGLAFTAQGSKHSSAADGAVGGKVRGFNWNEYGNPEEAAQALGAQTRLEVVGVEELEGHGSPSAAEKDGSKEADAGGEDGSEGGFGHGEMMVSMVIGLVMGVVLFIVAPAALTNLLVGEYDDATLAWNIVDGLLRVAVFVGYIWLIGRMQDIKTMFSYHGAEHKTIHCYEHGLPLTPENARSFPRLHVRCGTAFLIMVMIIAIFVYTITPLNGLISAWGVPDGSPKLALVIAARIVLMPVIAGVSYEITVKWAGSHPENPLVKVVLWPGMQMQYLTTREPDTGQLECAIAAMQLVLQREEAEEFAVAACEGTGSSVASSQPVA